MKKNNSAYVSFYIYSMIIFLCMCVLLLLTMILENLQLLLILANWEYNSMFSILMGFTVAVFGGNLLEKKNTLPEKYKELEKQKNYSIMNSRKLKMLIVWSLLLFVSGILYFRMTLYFPDVQFDNFEYSKLLVDFGIILSSYAGCGLLKKSAMYSKPLVGGEQ